MNTEHVAIVRQGTAAINVWRREHPHTILNLNGADMRGADLRKANLTGTLLEGANLTGALLGRAFLALPPADAA